MHLHLRNFQEAEKLFEKVLDFNKIEKLNSTEKLVPKVETMKILAFTKTRLHKRAEAVNLLDNVIKK